jgi:hypothetical protein
MKLDNRLLLESSAGAAIVNLDMPNFDIFYKGSYDEVTVFHPFNGWDAYADEELEDNEVQAIIRRLIVTRNVNRNLFVDIAKDLCTMQFKQIAILWHPEVSFEVDIYKGMSVIESKSFNRFEVKNNYEQSLDLEVLAFEVIKDYIHQQFCVVKVWENVGGCIYRSKSPMSYKKEFDISKLQYDKGQITYDGEDFSFTDGDGMSSRTMIFVDGVQIDAN